MNSLQKSIMKFFNPFLLVVFLSFFVVSCDKKTEVNHDKKENIAVKMESISLHISGMTCEIGCAKMIKSKLSKKEGIAKADVIFNDSIANVNFDANKISKKEVISFINGIAGGDLYKASELETK